MQCPRCTAQVDPAVEFCTSCGAPLVGMASDASGGTLSGEDAAGADAGAAAPARGRAPEVVRLCVAGFFERALAALIDGIIVLPLFVLLAWAGSAVTGIRIPPSRELNLDLVVGLLIERNGPVIFWSVMLLIVIFLYCFIFVGTRGQTPGKRLVGVRVVTWYGEPPTLLRALVRTAGYLASGALLWLGFIWIGFDREKRGLHDWIAGTYVVRT